MTTENAAILFTDVVGSTALASSLSPEGADEVRCGHFSILRQALAQAINSPSGSCEARPTR
jgi:class 3 adenylate cyclase